MKISDGQRVIIDANIFIYANQRISLQCVNILKRCANNEIMGILPMHILAEVMHVLMLAEARDVGLIKGSNPAKQLVLNPQLVKSLSRYESLIRDLLAIGLQLESLQREDFITAMSLQRKYGILTNDALLLAIALRMRITAVVSADSVFSRVHEIKHYCPDDLKVEPMT